MGQQPGRILSTDKAGWQALSVPVLLPCWRYTNACHGALPSTPSTYLVQLAFSRFARGTLLSPRPGSHCVDTWHLQAAGNSLTAGNGQPGRQLAWDSPPVYGSPGMALMLPQPDNQPAMVCTPSPVAPAATGCCAHAEPHHLAVAETWLSASASLASALLHGVVMRLTLPWPAAPPARQAHNGPAHLSSRWLGPECSCSLVPVAPLHPGQAPALRLWHAAAGLRGQHECGRQGQAQGGPLEAGGGG